MSRFYKTCFLSKYFFSKTSSNIIANHSKIAGVCRNHYSNFANRTINLKINDVSLNKYIKHLESEYTLLKNTTELESKQEERLVELQPVINILQDRNVLIDSIGSLQDLLEDTDAEIKKLAVEEKHSFEDKLKLVDEKLLEALLPTDAADSRDAIVLEVNAGVGGQEAMLFAKELFAMYCNFAEYKNWDIEVVEHLEGGAGGLRHGSALINGDGVFQYFKYEAGVHRVQRIPATERQGRIHTSTVSVLALPQPTNIEINIDNKDLRIETKKASGAGGQHVNTTDSAVRITYIPTGLSVECQVDRSQLKNKVLALQRLKALLYEEKLKSEMDSIANTKKSQVRSNFRNEKIRTYNFSQDRITDHRLQGNNVHNIKAFLTGGEPLENLINKLDKHTRIENLLNIVYQLDNK